jgi:hypothetical protein
MDATASAPVEQTPKAEPMADEKTEKSLISYETHRRLLDEKKKLQVEVEEFRARQREAQEAEARKRGEHDLLLKARDEELSKEREARKALEATIVNGQKLNAVIEALGGQVESKWFQIIDVSKVLVNPDTGEIDQMTAAKVAEDIRRQWPEMVRAGAKLPTASPAGNGQNTITRAEWMKLPYAKMKEYKHNQIID